MLILSNDCYQDLGVSELISMAVRKGEGVLSVNQSLRVLTGARTGRSSKDRYIVCDDITADTVDWGKVNQPYDEGHAADLWDRAWKMLQDKRYYVNRLSVGEDSSGRLPVMVVTEMAWHSLFARNMLIREYKNDAMKSWSLLCVPSFYLDPQRDHCRSDGGVFIDFNRRRILICGILYAGEIKKSLFSVMNFLMPKRDVLPMHCAANQGDQGDTALFFGLSGTGKTTLSSDIDRNLIGDDEHGWSDSNIFNFEGGCYAKCINLSKEKEPVIWDAIRYGSVMENVVLDAEGVPNFSDSSITQNTRVAYPRSHVVGSVEKNSGCHPKAVIFLSCDLFGVLPPVSVLNVQQAAYYFLSGYTALLGGTEQGFGKSIQTTFSACFGAAFMLRSPQVYAQLLQKRLQETGARVYLVNTGWHSGKYGQGGARYDISVTRAIVRAITDGEIESAELEKFPGFDFMIPKSLPGLNASVLDPRSAWPNTDMFVQTKNELITRFNENIAAIKLDSVVNAVAPAVVV